MFSDKAVALMKCTKMFKSKLALLLWQKRQLHIFLLWMIFHELCQIVCRTCMRKTIACLINIRTLRKSKISWTRNLRMCADSLLIKSYQFILLKIKLNGFFSVRKKTAWAYHMYDNNKYNIAMNPRY